MLTEHIRDAAATAAIFGFFGMSWFGWAQEHPPRSWRPGLITGSVVSALTLIGGGLLLWRHWSGDSAFDESTSSAFGIVVGIEFVLAGAGAVVLGRTGRGELTPVWIALVVGLHLFPVGAILDYPLMHVIGALVTGAALAAVPLARARSLPVSAVIGLAVGTALVAGGLVSLASAL